MKTIGWIVRFSFDRAGNRTKRVSGGVEERYFYDKRKRLTDYEKNGVHTEFQYDAAGNLLKDDRASYTYDAFNRNTKVETFGGNIQINHYDAEGLRHEMEENGKLVQNIFRDTEVIVEETKEEQIRYIRTHELLSSDAECARTYYHYAADEMGSITHVTTGNEILNRYEYDAWGNLTLEEERIPNRFCFNGQQLDPISQQYYLRARFYNPVLARFTQEDTYRGDGLNLYAYCKNNPVYYVDPSGHWCEKKQNIYERLLREEGLDPANIAPETRLRLMAQASNEARGKGPGDSGPVIALPDPVDTESNRPNALTADVPGESGSTTVIYGSDDIANYQYNVIENPGPLAEIPNQPAKNFYGGRYNMEVLQEDRIMYNGILRILMEQVNCIDSNESDGEKMKYLIESYSKLFTSRGGLSDFIIYDADIQLRNQLNEKYNDEVKRVWNIMKDYI